MIKMLRLMACTSALALVVACGSDDGDGGDDGGGDCEAADAPTYENFGQAFIQNNCLACHSAAATGTSGRPEDGYELETLEQVRALADNIHAVAVDSTMMPPAPLTVAQADRNKLGYWLDCGAP